MLVLIGVLATWTTSGRDQTVQRFGIFTDRSQKSLYGTETVAEGTGGQGTQRDACIAVFDRRNVVALQIRTRRAETTCR